LLGIWRDTSAPTAGGGEENLGKTAPVCLWHGFPQAPFLATLCN
jgi:hypothetical protein